MVHLSIELPESVLSDVGQDEATFMEEAKFILAAKLFDLGRLSSERAARLCGMDRVSFLFRLGTVGISAIQLDQDDYDEEFRRA